ncbi:MAG: ATP-binding cassette domain-containing protein [Clostridiales bacterium]|nr:ATP-binding cassette domain-containing protein [Clostridiales bacterium]
MASLSLRNVTKTYPQAVRKKKGGDNSLRTGSFTAVKDFNMEIADGEFVVFVGPSGCGKSTTLRMIAGLEHITSGELYIGDKLVNNVQPMNRDIAMVFQSYALYPHMTAYNNIAFGLRMRKIHVAVVDQNGQPVLKINRKKLKELAKEIKSIEKKLSDTIDPPSEDDRSALVDKKAKLEEEYKYYESTPVPSYKLKHIAKSVIDEKVKWAAKVLGIEDILQNKPSAMSGGQRQRIALGRAIVREPKVMLLDEPLSNLDAKLRTQMRSELVRLHNELKTTFIYVTHDQVEAMTMGTRIVVMKDGIVQQIDTPTNLFDYPDNRFVAGFIGTPQMNFFDVTVKKIGKKMCVTFISGEKAELSLEKLRPFDERYLDGDEHKAVMGIRGAALLVGKGENVITATVNITEVLGDTTQIYARLDGMDKDIVICGSERVVYSSGDKINVSFGESSLHFFDADSGASILKRE